MSRRKYRGSVSVDVDVDVDEVLSMLSDADLLEVLRERDIGIAKEPPVSVELIEGAYDALLRNDQAYARLQLEQYLFPKFKTLADCIEKYKAIPRKMP